MKRAFSLKSRRLPPIEGEELRLRILVVDDDLLTRRATVRVLRTLEEVDEVCGVDSAAAALAIVAAWLPDVILSDYRMPDRSGEELLLEVAARWPKIRRVLYSAWTYLPDSCAHAIVPKPATVDELRRACR